MPWNPWSAWNPVGPWVLPSRGGRAWAVGLVPTVRRHLWVPLGWSRGSVRPPRAPPPGHLLLACVRGSSIVLSSLALPTPTRPAHRIHMRLSPLEITPLRRQRCTLRSVRMVLSGDMRGGRCERHRSSAAGDYRAAAGDEGGRGDGCGRGGVLEALAVSRQGEAYLPLRGAQAPQEAPEPPCRTRVSDEAADWSLIGPSVPSPPPRAPRNGPEVLSSEGGAGYRPVPGGAVAWHSRTAPSVHRRRRRGGPAGSDSSGALAQRRHAQQPDAQTHTHPVPSEVPQASRSCAPASHAGP